MATMFSDLLASATVDNGLRIDVPNDWAQGRSVFGGLQGALAVRAMRSDVPTTPLRTLQVTFIAPVAGTLHARTSVLRAGTSATHVEARIFGADGALATVAVGVFGRARQSAVAVVPRPPVEVAATGIEMPRMSGIGPAFLEHFTARWLRGAFPASGTTETRHLIEVGLIDSVVTATEYHAIAIADFVPPLALAMLKTLANGSTLTWMLELVTDRFDTSLTGWRVDGELIAARDGYTNQSVMLWAPDGTPAALSRQSMAVFG